MDANQNKTNEEIKKEFKEGKNRFFEKETLVDYSGVRIQFPNKHKISTIFETIEVDKLDDTHLISLFKNIKKSIFFDIFFKNESAFYFEIDYFYDNLDVILFERMCYIKKCTADYENMEDKENAHNQNQIRKQLKILSSYYQTVNDLITYQTSNKSNDSIESELKETMKK